MEYEGIKLAIAGAGRWGFNHIKTASGLLGGGLRYVCDTNQLTADRLQEIGIEVQEKQEERERQREQEGQKKQEKQGEQKEQEVQGEQKEQEVQGEQKEQKEQGEQKEQVKQEGQGEQKTGDLPQQTGRGSAKADAQNAQEIIFTVDFEEVLRDETVNAVIIATSAETHYELAKKALNAGKNVLVEKPITLFTSEAKELHEIAEKTGLKLMVGHILLYHPAILKIKEMVSKGKLGKLQYIYSNRLNLGAIRTEENILWSFAPHDISVIQFFTNTNPFNIKATGAKFVQENIEDTTLTILEYPGNVHAHIYVSWLHPFKEQRLVVIGSEGMLTFEDTLKTDKLKYFKKGFKNMNGNIEKFESDYEVVEFDNTQPLAEEQKHFFDCIINNTRPRTDGKHALEVLEILEIASKQLKENR